MKQRLQWFFNEKENYWSASTPTGFHFFVYPFKCIILDGKEQEYCDSFDIQGFEDGKRRAEKYLKAFKR